jgi:hypothetical protein
MIGLARKSGFAFTNSPGDWKLVRFEKHIALAPQEIPCASWRLAARQFARQAAVGGFGNVRRWAKPTGRANARPTINSARPPTSNKHESVVGTAQVRLCPPFCNGPRLVNPFCVVGSPESRFCTGSAQGRHLMGLEEDRSTNLRSRAHEATWWATA